MRLLSKYIAIITILFGVGNNRADRVDNLQLHRNFKKAIF